MTRVATTFGVWLLAGVVMAASTATAKLDLRGAVARQRYVAEELETRAAEESLSEFMRQAWPILEPKTPLRWNWHLDAINEHLEGVTWGYIQYPITNAPPRNTKSMGVSCFWPAWEWIHKPHIRTLSVTGVRGLAMRDAVNTRTLIKSEWYQRRWGHKVKLVGDQNVKTYYVNSQRGSRLSASFDSDIVGQGGDRLSIDNPIDLRKADQAGELQRINGVWDNSLFSRVNDPQTSAKLITMQRVADNDLCGHVKDMHDWTMLVLPTEFTAKHRCRTFFFKDEVRFDRNPKSGRRERVVVATRPYTYEDPRTKDGELLNLPRFKAKDVASLKQQGAATFAAQQNQRPISREGKLIKRSQIRYFHPDRPPHKNKFTDIVLSCDPNQKAKAKNDFAVIDCWGRIGAHGFLLKKDRGRFEYPELLRKAKDMYRWAREAYPQAAMRFLIENTAAGPEMIADLKLIIPGITAVTADVDKERRVSIVTPMFEGGNVWVPGQAIADGSDYDKAATPAWVQECIEQWCMFSNVDHDDDTDTMSQALRRIQKLTAVKTDDNDDTGGQDSGERVKGRDF